jgi:hypothetical protein
MDTNNDELLLVPCLQVTFFVLEGPFALPPFQSLRHLILSFMDELQDFLWALVSQDKVLPETLSVTAACEYTDCSNWDLSFLKFRALKHLHLQNFAPKSVALPPDCKLHASFNCPSSNADDLGDWLGASNVWKDLFWCLASFQVTSTYSLNQPARADLTDILSRVQGTEYIHLSLPTLGSDREPLLIAHDSCQGLALAQTVRILCQGVCNIKITGITVGWANVLIQARTLYLGSDALAPLLHGLEAFRISSRAMGMRMVQALNNIGRQYEVNYDDDHASGLSELRSVLSAAQRKAYDDRMQCGCHCCLACLQRGGVLPACSASL